MNKIKRQSNICDFYDGRTKKRSILRHTTSIEDLSNELFLEIFDYLDGCDLYKAFLNLNKRFQNILSCSFLRVKINLSCDQQSNIRDYFTNVILPNKHEIVSICLLNSLVIDFFFQSMVFDSFFYRLESIVLFDIKSDYLIPFLLTLISIPKLYLLIITVGDRNMSDFSNVYRMIFNLSVLKYNKLCFGILIPKISVKNISSQGSSIKHLNLDHKCSLNDLANIFSYTPYLSRIVCAQLIHSYQSIEKLTISLPYLTHISIRSCSLQFNELEILIKKISSHLKMLRISTSGYEQYLDADRWEKLISQHIPHLRNFYFEYYEIINNTFEVTPHHALIHQFNSSFWHERGWIFKLKINVNVFRTKVTYSIHPYKKRWYEFYKLEENEKYGDLDTNSKFSNGTELIIFEPNFIDYNEALIDSMTSFFDIVHITKLDVVFEVTFVGMLLDLLRHLPNLNSLRVWSLSLTKPRCLHVEEEKIFRIRSIDNKIRKVNIRQMTELTQIQFLVDLCSHIQYFEIGISNDFDMKLLIKFILIKNRKRITHLRVLCFYIQAANDKMIEELQNIIKLKKIQYEFTIKRIDNRIYIQR